MTLRAAVFIVTLSVLPGSGRLVCGLVQSERRRMAGT